MGLRITADTDTFRVGAFGAAVTVRTHGSGAAELDLLLRRTWDRCLEDTAHEPPFGETALDVCVDPDPAVLDSGRRAGMIAVPAVREAMDVLTSSITVSLVTRRAGSLLMLHACGLADPRTGATLALVASSGTGKSTLARTLATRWGYVSDETVGVDRDGRVLAYPKPLSLLSAPDAAVKDQVAPADLGLLTAPADLRLAAVALLHRVDGGPRTPQVESVPTVHALAALAPETSYFTQQREPLRGLARLLRATGGLRRVTYAEASDLAPWVSGLLGEPA